MAHPENISYDILVISNDKFANPMALKDDILDRHLNCIVRKKLNIFGIRLLLYLYCSSLIHSHCELHGYFFPSCTTRWCLVRLLVEVALWSHSLHEYFFPKCIAC